jgi:hypothetical protein
MVLTTKDDIELDVYYEGQHNFGECCNNDVITHWWNFSPYGSQEAIYWIIRYLTVPGLAMGFIISMNVLGLFENPLYELFIYFLGIIGGFMLVDVAKERFRAIHYRIKDDEKIYVIKAKETYSPKEEEEEFTFTLNKIDDIKYTIGFVGDIMTMKDFDLEFHEDIKFFFKDVNLIVGNLEGIVLSTTEKTPLTKQRHYIPDILQQLEYLISGNKKWLLCLSNNHSADFGNANFQNSLNQIQNNGNFDVFGRNDVPNVLIRGKEINISSGTEWINKDNFECISRYKEEKKRKKLHCDEYNYLKNFYSNGKLNILYPHWGYENEKYVRSRVQKDAISLLTGKPQKYSIFQTIVRFLFRKKIKHDPDIKWDFIFGQHSHVRQPIMKVKDTITNLSREKLEYNRLVVFSGGNFISGVNIFRKNKHSYGIIMKCKIGPLSKYPERMAIGEVKWRRTVNNKAKRKNDQNETIKYKEVCVDREKYRSYNRSYLIIGLISLGLFGILWTLIGLFK